MKVEFGLDASKEVHVEVSRHQSVYKILFGKSGDNTTAGSLRHKREVDNKTNLKVTECGIVYLILLTRKLVAGSCGTYDELQGSIKRLKFLG